MLRTINFMGVRNVAFGVTVLLTVLALFSMFHKGMNYGLDFTGGTLIELTYEKPADLTKVRNELVSAGFHDAVVQSFGATTDLLVRMPGDDPLLGNKVAAALGQADTSNPAVISIGVDAVNSNDGNGANVCQSSGAPSMPARKVARQPMAPPWGRNAPSKRPSMPLMPAMLPVNRISAPQASPIRMPPASAVHGVK